MFSTEHPSPSNPMENNSMFTDDLDKEIRTDSSTPELNLLLDKLTEILRFRSACRRRYQHSSSSSVPGNLKRLQLTSNEPYHSHANEISSSPSSSSSSTTTGATATATSVTAAIVETEATFDGTTGGAWKSSHVQLKSSIANRPSPHHHHHHHHHHHAHHHHRHHQNQLKLFSNEKKRRLPCLLQRLIDDGNLIKEAVRRLKSQRFPAACQQQQLPMGDSPSTPTMKSSFPLLSTSIPISSSLNNSPSQSASSPNVNLSWFLSSNVVFSPVNHPSENGSPMRTLMEIGIHDG